MEKHTIGEGHLYQGRYKSFICQNDDHFITLVRYVEQSALKAHLVGKPEDWKWSSVWRRGFGNSEQKILLSAWPVVFPDDYLKRFGDDNWVAQKVKQFGLEQTLRDVGRPNRRKDS